MIGNLMIIKMKRTLQFLDKQPNYRVESKNQLKFHPETKHQYKLINNSY